MKGGRKNDLIGDMSPIRGRVEHLTNPYSNNLHIINLLLKNLLFPFFVDGGGGRRDKWTYPK